ncbi:MAG TPA: cobalamin ABC transporter substrate-binding protein, partial [Minicystis sp.]|nr:cobalamin ABC transporter substrate-binding protein [Minicystis sp.]
LGLMREGPSARADRFLRERAQTADVVGIMRVQTVTVETIGETKRYRLGVQVATPALAKPKLEDKTFELALGGTPVLAAGFEARLRGRTFVGFIHRYTGDDGEPAVHWHLSADAPDVVEAVKEAVALQEFARQSP